MSITSQQKVRQEIENGRTRSLLVRTARRVLPDDESEDAAHDAVVQALASAGRFREDAQVGTWLYRIAFNAALMKQRSARRASQRLLRAQHDETTAAPGPRSVLPSAAHALEENETRARLREAVARLPEAYRTAIERCVYAEQDAEQVAEELGITASALRTRIARARERLRVLLEGDPEADAEQSRAA